VVVCPLFRLVLIANNRPPANNMCVSMDLLGIPVENCLWRDVFDRVKFGKPTSAVILTSPVGISVEDVRFGV
jgi:hypothetical protein